MREACFLFAKDVFKKYDLLDKPGRYLEIGGTPEVFYQRDGRKLISLRKRVRDFIVSHIGGEPRIKHPIDIQPNPLKDLFPGLEFLDRGFNQEHIGTNQDYTIDFTFDDQVNPFVDSFDMVFSFDTLEHVNEPRAFARNMLRVVKPGGWAYLQTVFRYQYHPSPQDYFRFSPEGLREVFKDAAGDIVECDWENVEESPYILLRKPA